MHISPAGTIPSSSKTDPHPRPALKPPFLPRQKISQKTPREEFPRAKSPRGKNSSRADNYRFVGGLAVRKAPHQRIDCDICYLKWWVFMK